MKEFHELVSKHHSSEFAIFSHVLYQAAGETLVMSHILTILTVGWWMGGIAGMAFGAVVLGGVTRLTESGLSMVDWKLFGRKPPTTAEEWQIEFDKYKESPEFKYKNADITVEDFKFIWWMEYGHRMWGRTIGLFYYIPAGIMWAKGMFSPAIKKRVVIGGGLLLFQGKLYIWASLYMIMTNAIPGEFLI